MCFSEKLSYVAFAVGLSAVSASAIRAERESQNQQIVAAKQRYVFVAFGALIALIQFYEALMWRRIRLNQKPSSILQQLLIVTVLVQPFVIGLGMSVVGATHRDIWPRWQPLTVLAVTVVYAVVAFVSFIILQSRIKPATPNDCGVGGCRLDWKWVPNFRATWFVWFAVLFSSLLLVKPWYTSVSLIAFSIAISMSSWIFFSWPFSFGSKFCFFGVVLPWIVFALPLQPRASLAHEAKSAKPPNNAFSIWGISTLISAIIAFSILSYFIITSKSKTISIFFKILQPLPSSGPFWV